MQAVSLVWFPYHSVYAYTHPHTCKHVLALIRVQCTWTETRYISDLDKLNGSEQVPILKMEPIWT